MFMSKPLIIELPNAQGIIALPGQVLYRLHDSGQYLFPFGTKKSQPANFDCPKCRQRVRWLQTKSGSAVLSCHCFVAVCGRPSGTVTISEHLWFQWITDIVISERERLARQAN
jgi:hypothetical protein